MWMAVSGILAVVCVLLAFRLWSQERNLHSGARQLIERLKSDSTAKVDMALPNKAAEELLAAVNTLKETHRRENMESREREQALRRQIANVSHDLRTPLTSISGYLQLLEEGNLMGLERDGKTDWYARAGHLSQTGLYNLFLAGYEMLVQGQEELPAPT